MHMFTKILLGLACLLSVGLASLTVAYSANYYTLTNANRDLNTTIASLESSNNLANADQTQALQNKATEINSLSDQLGDIKAEYRQFETDVSQLRRDNAELQSSLDSQLSRSDSLIEGAKTATRIADGLRTDVSRLWDEKLDLQRQGLEMQDRINELESQYDVATQTIRALQEQIAEIGQGTSSIAGIPSGVPNAGVPPVTRTIEARVTEVGRDPGTGETLLKIDVGRNDGISDGMMFTVFRGSSQFLCRLKIERTDLQYSVGRADMLGKTGISVRPNDRAMISPR